MQHCGISSSNWRYHSLVLNHQHDCVRDNLIYWEYFIKPMTKSLNSSPLCAINLRWCTGSTLVQIVTCHLVGAKPSSEPMLEYFLLIGPLRTNFSEILITIWAFSFKEMAAILSKRDELIAMGWVHFVYPTMGDMTTRAQLNEAQTVIQCGAILAQSILSKSLTVVTP